MGTKSKAWLIFPQRIANAKNVGEKLDMGFEGNRI